MPTPMLDPAHPLAELLRRDQRFDFEAYVFVFDALRFAQERLNFGAPVEADQQDGEAFDQGDGDFASDQVERHVSGQELCEAMRQYALEQYGMLARSVLSHWGIRSTGDFGEIVFNLIDIGQMKKTDQDRREDFDDVFHFDALMDGQVFSGSDVPADAADED